MTSYRQLQSDDASDTFDLDSQPDSFQPREEVEVQIEPSRARTKSRVRLPNTYCTKNKVIVVLVVMLLVLLLISVLTIYELEKHGGEGEETKQTPRATTPVITTTQTPTTKASTVAPVTPTEATATNGEPFPWSNIRLPETATPSSYNIFLHPNLTTFNVSGRVEINFRTEEAVEFIVLHAKGMTVQKPEEVELAGQETSTIKVTKLLFYTQNDQISVHFARPLPAQTSCKLTLEFSYGLESGLDGFYRSSYKVDGVTRNIATTQFEATAARKAFPCFDEPALKANFSMTMIRNPQHLTLFNTPASERGVPHHEGGGEQNLVHDIYQPTVPMSTYLVAFVVCDFQNISDVTSSGTQVAVYAPAEQISQAQLALEVVNKTIPFYETLFDIDYPLPKQDMIAIPDFSAGAMENWGLITYREASVLYKPNVTSAGRESWIVVTITHELAHQWFGNLVTMEWWNDLWLNEGFATFVEYIGANHFQPDWHMMDMFILDSTHAAMGEDQLANSHPISVPVNNPDEISEIFDAISYSKGATILKMLQSFLMKGSQDIMMQGIQAYLKKYKFSNAKTADLWASISEVASRAQSGKGVDVAEMMDTWTLQMGFPMINMTHRGSKVTVTQQRFLIYPRGEPSPEFNSTYGYKWIVPLTYFTASNVSNVRTEILHTDQASTVLNIGDEKWFKANSEQSGMYRVNYDDASWRTLISVLLKHREDIPKPADRASLIDDAFHLAWAGYVDYSVPLDLMGYMEHEVEYVPLVTALGNLGMIGDVLYGREGYSYFKDYVIQLFDGIIQRLGREDTGPHLDRLLRLRLLRYLSELGHQDTLEWASGKYKDWMSTGKLDVGVNLRSTVRCGGLQYGHEDEWNFAWNKYLTTDSPTEKASLLYDLACTNDQVLLNRYLHWALDSDKIRQQDSDMVIGSVARNRAGSYMAFSFVVENWETIKEKIGDQPFVMTNLITGTTSWISSQFEYQIAKQFFDQHKDDAKQGTRALRQALQDIQMRIAWLETNEEKVTQLLKAATAASSSS
ncbi:endoplasmic reticulum aminopeptidase 1-like [Diadema antillarum]|uniref:endoplasmic reticulum aminopeptidase 1-like n=1 Tax=Diadema antillarum TaxID=105358 RepID=UPI003A8791C5